MRSREEGKEKRKEGREKRISLLAKLTTFDNTNSVAPNAVPTESTNTSRRECQTKREDKHHAQVTGKGGRHTSYHPVLLQWVEGQVFVYGVHRKGPTALPKLISFWEDVTKDIPKAITRVEEEASCHASNEGVGGTDEGEIPSQIGDFV